MRITICPACKKEFKIWPYRLKSGKKPFCSYFCRNKVNSLRPRHRIKPPWNKGIGILTSEDYRLRRSKEYGLWRIAIIVRDNYTCQNCGYKSHTTIKGKSDIQVDHIKPWVLYPELRFAIDNGRTLCVPCHKQTDTYGVRITQKIYD